MKKTIVLLFLSGIAYALPPALTWTVTQMGAPSLNSQNQWEVDLKFVNGNGRTLVVPDVIPFGAPPTQVADFAAGIINGLNNSTIALAQAPGSGGTVTPTVPSTGTVTTPPVDPMASVKQQFFTDYHVLRGMQTAIAANVMVSTDTAYTTQLSTVQNEFSVNESTLIPVLGVNP